VTLLCWLAGGCAGAIVDRVEGSWAVLELEDGSYVDWPVAMLCPGVAEGDRVEIVAISPGEGDRRRGRRAGREWFAGPRGRTVHNSEDS
jgi:hypothetical protein